MGRVNVGRVRYMFLWHKMYLLLLALYYACIMAPPLSSCTGFTIISTTYISTIYSKTIIFLFPVQVLFFVSSVVSPPYDVCDTCITFVRCGDLYHFCRAHAYSAHITVEATNTDIFASSLVCHGLSKLLLAPPIRLAAANDAANSISRIWTIDAVENK